MYTSQNKQYTHLLQSHAINSIQTHRTETTINKEKTYINKESYYKREANRPKDKQLTKRQRKQKAIRWLETKANQCAQTRRATDRTAKLVANPKHISHKGSPWGSPLPLQQLSNANEYKNVLARLTSNKA